MRKALTTLLLIIIAFTAWKSYSLWPIAPCTKPIPYSLGTFDKRFGVTEQAFLKALSEAEAIWEAPLGKELFAYTPGGALKVNLIYDYRQATTEELSMIEADVKGGEAQYRALEAEYRGLKSEYAALKESYDARVADFDATNEAYEQHVESCNAGPRTSKSEFEALERERRALERQVKALDSLEDELNAKVRELNTVVGRLNALAKSLNLNVEEYNAVGATRGETFAGGTYTSDASGEYIDIFEFQILITNRDEK